VRDDAAAHGPVVAAVNGSPASLRALAWAARHASLTGCPLVAIYAWFAPAAVSLYGYIPDMSGADADAHRFIASQIESADLLGVEVDVRAVEGPASTVLLNAAADASALVVGSRGHKKLPGSLLGSVSDQVVHHATGTVVVVP